MPYRVGSHYSIHLYRVTPEGHPDIPIATASTENEAQIIVSALNAAEDDEALAFAQSLIVWADARKPKPKPKPEPESEPPWVSGYEVKGPR